MPVAVTVIGDGGWGTALAILLHGNGHTVRVWGPFADYIETIRRTRTNPDYLPGVAMPPGIDWHDDPAAATVAAELVVLAVPSRFYVPVLERFRAHIPRNAPLVSVTKGLDAATHRRMTELATAVLGNEQPVLALSGPSHAEEVARGVPTAVVLAGRDAALAARIQSIFGSERFRVYTSGDIIGVELGGALKNVIAVAVGASEGLGFGANTRAALITRGLAEMARLGTSLGAQPATFAGLSGMGDLIVTCTSHLSRNWSVGNRMGKGEPIAGILAGMKQVAEGVHNCESAYRLAESRGVEMPITEQVYAMVCRGRPPMEAVQSLLARPQREER